MPLARRSRLRMGWRGCSARLSGCAGGGWASSTSLSTTPTTGRSTTVWRASRSRDTTLSSASSSRRAPCPRWLQRTTSGTSALWRGTSGRAQSRSRCSGPRTSPSRATWPAARKRSMTSCSGRVRSTGAPSAPRWSMCARDRRSAPAPLSSRPPSPPVPPLLPSPLQLPSHLSLPPARSARGRGCGVAGTAPFTPASQLARTPPTHINEYHTHMHSCHTRAR